MGTYYSGGMGVGAYGYQLGHLELDEQFECLDEWADFNDLHTFSPYEDCDFMSKFICFKLDPVYTKHINELWVVRVKQLGSQFKALTGVDPVLLGMQNIL